MPQPKDWIPAALRARGKKQIDLARELNADYYHVCKVIGGYVAGSPDFDSRVRHILSRWDREITGQFPLDPAAQEQESIAA